MENYTKGRNVEEPLSRETINISNIPTEFMWMEVKGGSKMRNLLTEALKEFPNIKAVVWTGCGPSVSKAVSCAEIMKREYGKPTYQTTTIAYRCVEEYWEPKIPELDQLVVKRKLPLIHILITTDPHDSTQLSEQQSKPKSKPEKNKRPIKRPKPRKTSNKKSQNRQQAQAQ